MRERCWQSAGRRDKVTLLAIRKGGTNEGNHEELHHCCHSDDSNGGKCAVKQNSGYYPPPPRDAFLFLNHQLTPISSRCCVKVIVGETPVVRPVTKSFWSPLLEGYWPEAKDLLNALASAV